MLKRTRLPLGRPKLARKHPKLGDFQVFVWLGPVAGAKLLARRFGGGIRGEDTAAKKHEPLCNDRSSTQSGRAAGHFQVAQAPAA